MTTVNLTLTQINTALVTPGAFLAANQFSYSIANASSTWSYYGANTQPHNSYSVLSAAQANAFRAAISAWDSLIAPNFTEVTETASTAGEIRVAFTSYDMNSGTAAYAYLPSNRIPNSKDGDVWINANSTAESFASGTDNYGTLLHEIGHAMGLKHPFEVPKLPVAYDTTRYTVMSYTTAEPYFSTGFTSSGPGSLSTTSQRVIVTTPMVLDIAAIQSIYGASTTTNAGNTVYNLTQGDMSITAIHDAGGIDTLNMSSFTRANLVDLRPGSYSSIGYFSTAAQIAHWQALYPQFSTFISQVLNEPDTYQWVDNFGIAFSTVIENATGGSGDDVMVGNDVANTLIGNGGNDTLSGGIGDDILDGGAGIDRLHGGTGNDHFTVDRVDDLVFENAGEGTDTVTTSAGYYLYANIENLVLATGAGNIFGVGNDFANTLTGNAGANLLLGGGGNDAVNGGAGDDQLYGEGGVDTMFGEAGIDYLIGGAGNDVLDGGTESDGLYGEDGDDTLIGGTGFFSDILDGGAGNDILRGDSGLGEQDHLNGGAGDDAYYVDSYADLTYEAVGGGTDTVYATINGTGYYLYANVENLVLGGNTPFGVGNDLANQLTGSAAANWLLGGAGNDTLNGKAGNDVLFGEGGADTFVFETGNGGDTIGDFQVASDKINLAAFGFTTFAQVMAMTGDNGGTAFINLGSGNFIVLNGVAKASLAAGNFILSGGADAVDDLTPELAIDALEDLSTMIHAPGSDRLIATFDYL